MRRPPRKHTRRLASINPQHFKKKSVVINPDNVVKITAPKRGYVRFEVEDSVRSENLQRGEVYIFRNKEELIYYGIEHRRIGFNYVTSYKFLGKNGKVVFLQKRNFHELRRLK